MAAKNGSSKPAKPVRNEFVVSFLASPGSKPKDILAWFKEALANICKLHVDVDESSVKVKAVKAPKPGATS